MSLLFNMLSRQSINVSKYLKVINLIRKHLNYVLAFYFDKYTFLMPWNARFNLRSFRFPGVLWSNTLVWEQGAGTATWPDPSPLCFPLWGACMWVCVFTPWAAHWSALLPGQHSHSAYPKGVRDMRQPWRLSGGCLAGLPESQVSGGGSRWGSGLLALWGRPREKRVRTQSSQLI